MCLFLSPPKANMSTWWQRSGPPHCQPEGHPSLRLSGRFTPSSLPRLFLISTQLVPCLLLVHTLTLTHAHSRTHSHTDTLAHTHTHTPLAALICCFLAALSIL